MIRFQKNGEDEVACSLELLRELSAELGSRFLDLLVADALYLQAPFVEAIEGLGLDWVITLKKNQPELLAESERLISSVVAEKMDEHPELQLWHAPEVSWPVAERTIRVVKTVRQQPVKHLRVQRDEQGRSRGERNSPRAEHEFLRQHLALATPCRSAAGLCDNTRFHEHTTHYPGLRSGPLRSLRRTLRPRNADGAAV